MGVACAVQNNVSIDQQNQNGLTPLHRAAGRDARLIADVLTASPNKAPWTRDGFGRLPLDIAREAGNNELGDRLERYTYPQLYRHEQDGPVPSHLLTAFNELRMALGCRDTSPAYAPEKMREEQAQRLMAHERDENEMER